MPRNPYSELWRALCVARVPDERRFAPTFNSGKVVPEIDVILDNPDDYPSSKKKFTVDESLTSTASRVKTVHGRKIAFALHLRNPLAEDPLGCPRRRENKGRRVFQDCVVSSTPSRDKGWYKCTDCVFSGDQYQSKCKVRPARASDNQQPPAVVNDQVGRQAMSQSSSPLSDLSSMDGDFSLDIEPPSQSSVQPANNAAKIEVQDEGDNEKGTVKRQTEAQDEHADTKSQGCNSLFSTPAATQRSADASDHYGVVNTNEQALLTAQEMLLEAKSGHDQELQRVKQEAADRERDLVRRHTEEIDRLVEEHITAVVELTVKSQNRIVDLETQNKRLETQNKRLLEDSQRLAEDLETKIEVKNEQGVEIKREKVQLQDVGAQLNQCKQELAAANLENTNLKDDKVKLEKQLEDMQTSIAEYEKNKVEQHVPSHQELLEAATQEIAELKKSLGAETKKASDEKAQLAGDAAARERQMRAFYEKAGQNQVHVYTKALNAELEKAKKELVKQLGDLREVMKKKWEDETANLRQENRTLTAKIGDLEIERAEMEIKVLKTREGATLAEYLAKEAEIEVLKMRRGKRGVDVDVQGEKADREVAPARKRVRQTIAIEDN